MVWFSNETDGLVSWNHPHDVLGLFWHPNRSLLTNETVAEISVPKPVSFDGCVSLLRSFIQCVVPFWFHTEISLVWKIYWSLWHWNPSLLTDGITSVDHSDGVASCWSLLTPQQVSFERCAGLFRSFRRLPCWHTLQHTQQHTATHWTCWSRSMLQASACRTRWRYQSLFVYTLVTLNRKISFFSYICIYIQTQICMFLWGYRSGCIHMQVSFDSFNNKINIRVFI